MGRSELPLEAFVRSQSVNLIAQVLKGATPVCNVHDYEPMIIFCRDCSQAGCDSCWQ